MNERKLQIDLADPDDVRAKLPAALKIARETRRDAEEAIDLADRWGRLVTVLESVASEAPASEPVETPVEPPSEPPEQPVRMLEQEIVQAELEATPDAAPEGSHSWRSDGRLVAEPGKSSASLILEVLNQAGKPIHWKEVARRLPHFKPTTVSWNLSVMEREGLISRPKRGVYAPLNHGADEQPDAEQVG